MSLIVDVSADGVRAPVGRERLKNLAVGVLKAERARDALLSIALVSSAQIARLNRAHLGHSGATDVISFALTNPPSGPGRQAIVGDIYIAPAVARANAARMGTSIRLEIARLVVHGTLHVLGHDHPDGAGRTTSPMWRRQEQLLARLTSAGRSGGKSVR